MKSKTIILSKDNDQGRGILTIYKENDLLECKLRLYNINSINRFCKLGIYHHNQVFSANLLEKNGVYLSSMVGEFNIDDDFYAAIINTKNNNEVIVSGGTYSGYFFNEDQVFDKVQEENPNTNLFNYEEYEIENLMSTPKSLETKNETETTPSFCETGDCSKCKYKEFFYSNIQPNTLNKKEEIETKNNQSEENHTIIKSLLPQFNYVFEHYPKDDVLNSLLPNSKFVKINENESSYSIGAIYENENMKYICYAVMCDYNSPVPKELGNHYQWLPIDKQDPLSEGYYIVFQDAEDLKIVEL